MPRPQGGSKRRPREGFLLPEDRWGIWTNSIRTVNSHFEKIQCRAGHPAFPVAGSVLSCGMRPDRLIPKQGCGFHTGEGSPHGVLESLTSTQTASESVKLHGSLSQRCGTWVPDLQEDRVCCYIDISPSRPHLASPEWPGRGFPVQRLSMSCEPGPAAALQSLFPGGPRRQQPHAAGSPAALPCRCGPRPRSSLTVHTELSATFLRRDFDPFSKCALACDKGPQDVVTDVPLA